MPSHTQAFAKLPLCSPASWTFRGGLAAPSLPLCLLIPRRLSGSIWAPCRGTPSISGFAWDANTCSSCPHPQRTKWPSKGWSQILPAQSRAQQLLPCVQWYWAHRRVSVPACCQARLLSSQNHRGGLTRAPYAGFTPESVGWRP